MPIPPLTAVAPSHDGSAVRGKSKAESLKKNKLLSPTPSPQEIKIGAELQQFGFDQTYLAWGLG